MNRIYLTRYCYIKDNVCYIPLSNGSTAVCDEDRFAAVSKYSWRLDRNGYPCAKIKDFTIRLHSFLYKNQGQIDHVNGSKVDNRSCNLRFVNHCQNRVNVGKKKNTKNKFKGITFNKRKNKWQAQIGHNYKNITIGSFDSQEDAAKAYDKKAQELYGEYARLNFSEVILREWE